MPPPGGRGRGRHGRRRLPVEQIRDLSLGGDAPQTRSPYRSRDMDGDSAPFMYGRPNPSRGRAIPEYFGGHSIPGVSGGRAIPQYFGGHSIPGVSGGRAIPEYFGGHSIPAVSGCRARHSPSRDRPLPPLCPDRVAEPPSAQMLQQPKVSYLNKSLGTATLKESSVTATSSTLGSPILVRKPTDWNLRFLIRIDRGGSFHTYPDLGGPFQSLQEAESAINRHLHDRQHPTMFKKQDGVSLMDIAIRKCMYWPDGTRRRCSQAQRIEGSRSAIRVLVQVLVDKYNDEHNLLGDLAYELKDVMDALHINEGYGYFHLNFTTYAKGADDSGCGINNLFFAEVAFVRGEDDHDKMVVSCFCMVKPNDNGHCYGCLNEGRVHMKHPNNTGAYIAGHLDLPSGCCIRMPIDDDDVQAEEDRIRKMYKGLDDPKLVAELLTFDGATPMV